MLKHVARLTSVSVALALLGAGAAYAQSAEALAAPEEPPPVLPTTGDGGAVVKVLGDVCQPLLAGNVANFPALAASAGFTQDRRTEEWVRPLAQRPFQIAMRSPSTVNRNVCELRIRYAPGWQGPIIEALNVYRFLHAPQLRLQRNEQATYTDAERTTTTWDNFENQGFDGHVFGLIMVQLRNTDGTSLGRGYDEAIIQYAKRPALPEFIEQARAYTEQMRAFEEQQRRAAEAGAEAAPAPDSPTATVPAADPASAAAQSTLPPAS